MAEHEHHTFEENPVEYCKTIYKLFDDHNLKQQPAVVDNRKFFEGVDADLEARAQNAKVVRSTQFIQELRPAIESMLAVLVDNALEQNNPVKFIPSADSEDDPAHLNNLEDKLNEEMRTSGVLTSKYIEILLGAAFAPVVACKLGWEEKEGWDYVKVPMMERFQSAITSLLLGSPQMPPAVRKVWGVTESGPYCEVLDYDEFLYDYRVDNISNSECLIHRKWVTMEEIEAQAVESDYDPKAIESLKEEYQVLNDSGSGNSESSGTVADRSATATEPDREYGYKDGKILLSEFWIPTIDDQGRDETKIFVLASNKFKLSRGKYGKTSQWGKMKYNFIVFRFNKQFNRIEGTPLVEIGKPAQKIYNNNINAFMDYLTYNVFPVLIRAQGTSITGKPTMSPGAVWDVQNPEGLTVLHVPAQDVNSLLAFADLMENKVKQLVNSPAPNQGTETAPDETATATVARAKGSTIRNRIPAKQAGDLLIEIAQMYIYMHQAMEEEEWIVDVKVDVPSLTGAKTPQEEREEAIYLLEQAKTNPLYTTPTGMLKLRRLTEEVYLKFRKRNIDEILPTEAELSMVDPIGAAVEQQAEEIEQTNMVQDGSAPGKVIPMGGQQEETQ